MTFNDLTAQEFEDLAERCFSDGELANAFLNLHSEEFEEWKEQYLSLSIPEIIKMFLEFYDDEYIEYGFEKYAHNYGR